MLALNWIVFILGFFVSLICIVFGITLASKNKSFKVAVSVFITAIIFAIAGYLAATRLGSIYKIHNIENDASIECNDTFMKPNTLYKDLNTGGYVLCIKVFGDERVLIAYEEPGQHNIILALIDIDNHSQYIEMTSDVDEIEDNITSMKIDDTYNYIIGHYNSNK